jgi:hypothetical protein
MQSLYTIMELYNKILKIVDANLIYCLIPMILTLFLIETLFKNKFPTKKALRFIGWIILSYTAITLLHFVVGIILYPDKFEYIFRTTRPYKIFYWIIFLSATITPFTLLIKKLASKLWYVLLVAFLMKTGAYFEYFVIVTTSINRDYTPENSSSDLLNLWSFGLSMIILQSILLVILILGVLKITERKKLHAIK